MGLNFSVVRSQKNGNICLIKQAVRLILGSWALAMALYPCNYLSIWTCLSFMCI